MTSRKAHPGLLVDDLDAWATRLRAAGHDIAFDDDFPGMRRFYSTTVTATGSSSSSH